MSHLSLSLSLVYSLQLKYQHVPYLTVPNVTMLVEHAVDNVLMVILSVAVNVVQVRADRVQQIIVVDKIKYWREKIQ